MVAKKTAAKKTAAAKKTEPPVDPRVPTIEQMNDPAKALEGLMVLLKQIHPDLTSDSVQKRAEELMAQPLVPPSP